MSMLSIKSTSGSRPDTVQSTSELQVVLDAAGLSPNDGFSFVSGFETDLSTATGAKGAVVVSSDSAMMIVVTGALAALRGQSICIPAKDCPGWVISALRQAGLFVTKTVGHDCVAVFGPPGTEPQPSSPLILDLTGEHPSDWQSHLATCAIAMIPLTDGESLSTGEGGVILFHDNDLAETARSYAQFGCLDGIHPGVNSKLSALQAALGRSRLRNFFPHLSRLKMCGPKTRTDSGDIPDRFDPSSPADAQMLERALNGSLAGSSETVGQYEAALAHWYDAEDAISVSSGFAAVLVAFAALGLEPGDEVLLAPTCPLCTVYALSALGIVPVFCDTSPDSFSIDLKAARAALSPRTRAVMDVPMWGYPVQADAVAQFAKSSGLAFILDLALGHGTELNGRHIWNEADVATFSTHASKTLVTGEGGFVLTRRADLAGRIRKTMDDNTVANCKLAGLQAGLGLARLPYLHAHIVHRRDMMHEISLGLSHPDLEPFPVVAGGCPTGVKMIVRHKGGDGIALNQHLAQSGIPSDILAYRCRPLYKFPILANRQADCPNAAAILSSVATLPVHPDIDSADVARMVHALNSMPTGRPQ